MPNWCENGIERTCVLGSYVTADMEGNVDFERDVVERSGQPDSPNVAHIVKTSPGAACSASHS